MSPEQVVNGEVAPVAVARLSGPVDRVARELLGTLLLRRLDDQPVVARIVETEAYGPDDPASHSVAGPTPRCRSMFAAAGTAYVYRSYGVHWMLNVVVSPPGVGAAVLVRAAAVLDGQEVVRGHRPSVTADHQLLRGPGCLGQGLDLDAVRHDGANLLDPDAELWLGTDGWRPAHGEVVAGPRVGVRHAAEVPWRFHLSGRPAVSAYRRSPRAPVR